MSLMAESVDLSSFQANSEFHLEDALATTEGGKALAFSLILRRRPGPHLLRQVLPCCLVSTLAALTFLVPPSSAERVTLAIGCLLSLLLVSVAGGGAPRTPTPQIPLLSIYQICSLCLVSAAAFLSALTLSLHGKGLDGTPPPPWLSKCVIGCLGPLLFVQPCPSRKRALGFQEADEEDRRRGKRAAAGGAPPSIERYSSSPQLLRRRSGGGGGGGERSSDEFERRFLRVLDRVHETLERNEARDMEMEGKEAAREEWRKVAQVGYLFERTVIDSLRMTMIRNLVELPPISWKEFYKCIIILR
ncbi:Ligand-gated ion channel 4, partial [Stegodyphus mimosarum]